MRHWFQNLNDGPRKKLFYFRGSIGSNARDWFRYEMCSGPKLRLSVSDDDGAIQLSLGLIFFSVFITAFFLGTPKWMQGRTTNIYLFEWGLWWNLNMLKWESSSKDPKWRRGAIHLDELLVGKRSLVHDKICSVENVEFKLGGKLFVMDEIKWERWQFFRHHIPFSLYHEKMFHVDMKINRPPQRAGKGENSWDCGDDGTYGISMKWNHLPPRWDNTKECAKLAVQDYVQSVMRDVKRYGGSSSERGIGRESEFEYIGIRPWKPDPSPADAEEIGGQGEDTP